MAFWKTCWKLCDCHCEIKSVFCYLYNNNFIGYRAHFILFAKYNKNARCEICANFRPNTRVQQTTRTDSQTKSEHIYNKLNRIQEMLLVLPKNSSRTNRSRMNASITLSYMSHVESVPEFIYTEKIWLERVVRARY